MLEQMKNLPGNVVGFRASGKVTGKDYETVLAPAVEAMMAEHDKIRLIYHLDEGVIEVDAAAMWEDARIGIKSFSALERSAIVTDIDWIRNAVKLFGFAMPGEVKTFRSSDLQTALDWITA